jgi:uroporphyrinogen-III synthase
MAGIAPGFGGLRVLALESRRAPEIATLIRNSGGEPLVAPALREVPLESNAEALAFAESLQRGEVDVVIFLTGVGTRALVSVVEHAGSRESFLAALRRAKVVARGPKPMAALREVDVPVWLAVPEPNTWRELLAALDAKASEQPLAGARVAVQEYGISNVDLLDGLRTRGAQVTRVPVYRWALPEDIEPLKAAVNAVARGEVDLVMFTTGMQVVHLLQVAQDMHLHAAVLTSLTRMVIASIGPTTSEELQRHGLAADMEPSHPKMGFLVREAAERAGELLRAKRSSEYPDR